MNDDSMNPTLHMHVHWVVKNKAGAYLSTFAAERTGSAFAPAFVGPWPLKVRDHRFGERLMEARRNDSPVGGPCLRVFEEHCIATFTSLRLAKANAESHVGTKVFRVTVRLKSLKKVK